MMERPRNNSKMSPGDFYSGSEQYKEDAYKVVVTTLSENKKCLIHGIMMKTSEGATYASTNLRIEKIHKGVFTVAGGEAYIHAL